MKNKFKGFGLVAWRTMDGGLQHCMGGGHQNHLQEKQTWGGNVVAWGGLKNSWENRQVKDKADRERFTQWNAEFQRIAYCQNHGFSSSHVCMWELDYKEGWALKTLCFWTVVLEICLRPPQATTLPSQICFSWVWFWWPPPTQCYKPPSNVLQATRPNPLNLFFISTI